jgi:RecB family exonuclease
MSAPAVSFRPLVLLVPSRAAAVELPRRLASTGRALAGVYPLKVKDLARALAEPLLLGRGLRAWQAGHDALLAARLLAQDPAGLPLLPEAPRAPVSEALARTLVALRRAGIVPARLAGLAQAADDADAARRLGALASLYARYHATVDAHAADLVTQLAAAREALPGARWLQGAEVIVVDDLELEPVELEFVAALAEALPVRVLRRALPASLRAGAPRTRLAARGVAEAAWEQTPLAPLTPPAPPASLAHLRERLFEPPERAAPADDAVTLLTAPGEAAEARAIVRRMLREAARGVPFEEMGIVLPRPDPYAPLFADLLGELKVPFKLHPSLPLRTGRAARSLLLLLRCRGLERRPVLEFLTFAPVPWETMLGPDRRAWPSRWDRLSREAGIVSGFSRWLVGLRAYAEAERDAAARESEPERRARRERHVEDAESLLRVVEILGATLEGLSGEATWAEWVERLSTACDQWIGEERDREALLEVVADLGGLGSVAARAPWSEVEQVLEARLEWERVPLDPVEGGALHVGALDAMAGLPFRVVAIPGLVEGGYPGVFRPDPFLLDAEREALGCAPVPAAQPSPAPTAAPARRARGGAAQLALFDTAPAAAPAAAAPPVRLLPTSQDRLLEARRLFQRAIGQAGERLILSYPRADARTGRERLPSLFFAAAASALAGRPLAGAELDRAVVEDELDSLPLEDALDPGERDRARVRRDEQAAATIAGASPFFRQSRLASQARVWGRLTRYDGLLSDADEALRERLSPLRDGATVSASRLATYARCGFQYLLQAVLHLQPAPEPEERRRIDPLERGDLFHRVAERFLRERRERGELPLRDDPTLEARLAQMAEEALEGLVAGCPPRFVLLWQLEKRRFHEMLKKWLGREIDQAGRSLPLHFEVGFGLGERPSEGEPHDPRPLEIDLGEGRTLRVCGKIDRIDRRGPGELVLRDYKTGRAPRDDGGVFRGGKQLQIPFYVLAAERLFPGEKVADAFLDYVDAGRPVAFRPEAVTGEPFRELLRSLVGLIAGGVFVQEPSSCEYCDFTAVCGPSSLLQRRRNFKLRDRSLQEYLRLRDVV